VDESSCRNGGVGCVTLGFGRCVEWESIKVIDPALIVPRTIAILSIASAYSAFERVSQLFR
jgi:hypothetical protein